MSSDSVRLASISRAFRRRRLAAVSICHWNGIGSGLLLIPGGRPNVPGLFVAAVRGKSLAAAREFSVRFGEQDY